MKKLVILVALSVFLSGCFPGLTSRSSGTATKPGEYIRGKSAKGFPALPLYPEAKLIETYGTDGSYGASAYTRDELEKVILFYDGSFGKLGWDSNKVQNASNITYEVNNSKYKGRVIINRASDNETVAITLAVAPR